MPALWFWGEDDFALRQAAEQLLRQTLDPAWESFNCDRFGPEQPEAVRQALNQAMTPPFGAGQRLVWLVETTLAKDCSEVDLAELQRTLPLLPETTVLLLTSTAKPNGRLKSTKLFQQHGELREFAAIPPWKTDLLLGRVQQTASDLGLRLDREATEALAIAVGNQTRQLHGELEKLKLFAGDRTVTAADVAALVTTSTQSSLQLAAAIREGDTPRALGLVADLIARNEAPLRISATLVGQFRTWLWVKALQESGERDQTVIAAAAELGNPKRLFFIQKEIGRLSARQLARCLDLLRQLDWGLKQGADPVAHLQTQVVQLCACCRGQELSGRNSVQ